MLPPLKQRDSTARIKPFVAYDLETTRIEKGTPTPLYVTAFGENFALSMPITGANPLQNFCDILETHFLILDRNMTRFVAWYGNQFDVYFVSRALLKFSEKWVMRPYLTSNKQLRGLRVTSVDQVKINGRLRKMQFEFLDGAAMTGLNTANMKLVKFLKLFAPHMPKKKLDLEKVKFNPLNKTHVEYAERDSEGLYVGFKEANRIVKELTGNEFQATIGGLAIRYFQSKMPPDKLVWEPPYEILDRIYDNVMRGGYCWIQRQFTGKVWKYDLNQAYAAAMRDCNLPAGRCYHTLEFMPGKCGVYHCYVGRGAESLVPFYYKSADKDIAAFTAGAYVETWLTNIELQALARDGWQWEIIDGSVWDDSFSMSEMVNELERLRFTDPAGPQGPLGIICKCIGNNAYGKTAERLEGLELLLAAACPEGFNHYMAELPEMENVFFRMRDPIRRPYHRPQIAAFITAHVRMLVREAALKNADSFLYADTDCICFSKPVDESLDIDPTRYGAWKKEADGIGARIIGKKVYFMEGKTAKEVERKAKGLNVSRETVFIEEGGKLVRRRINEGDYKRWMNGKPPAQRQVQRNNFVNYLGGANMFRDQDRHGTDVTKSDFAYLDKYGFFHPISY